MINIRHASDEAGACRKMLNEPCWFKYYPDIETC
jgi:hypothetical protein